MNLLLMIMRAAFAERMIASAKAAARRSALAAFLIAATSVAAFFAVSLAIVAGVIALSEVLPPALAALAVGAAFLVLAAALAALARQAVRRVTRPGPAVAPVEAKALTKLSPQTIEVLVACGVAVILGVMAGRANQARSKPAE